MGASVTTLKGTAVNDGHLLAVQVKKKNKQELIGRQEGAFEIQKQRSAQNEDHRRMKEAEALRFKEEPELPEVASMRSTKANTNSAKTATSSQRSNMSTSRRTGEELQTSTNFQLRNELGEAIHTDTRMLDRAPSCGTAMTQALEDQERDHQIDLAAERLALYGGRADLLEDELADYDEDDQVPACVQSSSNHRTYNAAVTSSNGFASTRGGRSASKAKTVTSTPKTVTAAVTSDVFGRAGSGSSSVASTNSNASSFASTNSNVRGRASVRSEPARLREAPPSPTHDRGGSCERLPPGRKDSPNHRRQDEGLRKKRAPR